MKSIKSVISFEVIEENYHKFIKYFDTDFNEWHNEEAIESKIYELLNEADYCELSDCPYVYDLTKIESIDTAIVK